MRLLEGNSALRKRSDKGSAQAAFQKALLLTVGAAIGSILATIIGFEYTCWAIILLCWPVAAAFSMYDRAKEKPHRGFSPSSQHPNAGRPQSPPPRPPLTPHRNGLRRIK